MDIKDISTCIQDWDDLHKEFTTFEAFSKEYQEKLDELGELQAKCSKEWKHQIYRLNIIDKAVKRLMKDKKNVEDKQLLELSKNIERRFAQLREIEQTLPKSSNGLYLKIILGNVNVSILNKNDKYVTFCEDYLHALGRFIASERVEVCRDNSLNDSKTVPPSYL